MLELELLALVLGSSLELELGSLALASLLVLELLALALEGYGSSALSSSLKDSELVSALLTLLSLCDTSVLAFLPMLSGSIISSTIPESLTYKYLFTKFKPSTELLNV